MCIRDRLKIKRRETVDVAVLGVRKTEGFHRGIPESFLVGLLEDSTGEWVRLGHVSSGLGKIEKMALLKVCRELANGEDDEYLYVEPEIVFEIEFQEFLGHSFRSPRIKRIRWDKPARECLLSQLNRVMSENDLEIVR